MKTLPPVFADETTTPLFPPQIAEMLRHRLRQGVGVALCAVAFLMSVAVLGYAPLDPSFNTSSGGADISNPLGATGAVLADSLVQGFGLGWILVMMVPAAWGARLVLGMPLTRVPLRLLGVFVAVLLGVAGFAGLKLGSTWPYGIMPGGSVGTLALHGVTGLLPGAWGNFGPFWAPLLCAGLGALLFFPALGFSAGQWGRGSHRALVLTLGTLALLWMMARKLVARLRGKPIEADDTDDFYADESEDDDEVAADESDEDDAASDDLFDDKAEEEEPKRLFSKPAKKRRVKTASGDRYEFPPLDILALPKGGGNQMSDAVLRENAEVLLGVLGDFGIQGEIIGVSPGPVVTQYELEPAPGTKSARVIGLSDDIARQMSALSVRVATVPGRNVLGIELSNVKRETVYLRELLAHASFKKSTARLPLALGKDIAGEPVVVDMARMPHLLVAGTTGSGKSVSVNAMILSLLYARTPDQVRLIMIDPKMLELSIYEGIPHLLTPVVTEPKKAVVALKWTVREMEDRYRAMARLGVRNIDGYNERVRKAKEDGETPTRRVQTGFDADTGKPVYEEQPIELVDLPYIVVVVDEMADLMLVAGKDIEAAVQRLAQMARAAGIHLIMATQRPSVDVITGTIKANFPSRISFQVTSKIDSRTILSEQGAEQLLGQGDMLYMASGGRIVRVHGPFVADAEVESVVAHLKTQGEPAYLEEVTKHISEDEDGGTGSYGEEGSGEGGSGDDGLYDRAVQIVLRERKASTSYIQRCLQIGYNRAARLIDRMEAEGLVSPANHVGKREILVPGESAR